MRRVPVLAVALCLAATGCSTSDIDPDATVRISGRALDAAGKPLSDTSVLLFKQADLGELLVGTVLAIGTFSTVCFLPDPPAVCAKAHQSTTDADGRYEFELEGSDTQGTLGTRSTLSVVFAGRSAQDGTAVSFTAEDPEIDLPDARLWRARAEVSRPPGEIALSWSPLQTGDDVDYTVRLFDETGTTFWSDAASGERASVDARILEDRSGEIAIDAASPLSGGTGAGDVFASRSSARLPVEATAGAPPSRGGACAAVTGSRGRLAAPEASCPLTDGDLATPAGVRVGAEKVVTGYVIDLGAVRPVDLVVARGFAGQILVEVSTDGTTYQPVGSEQGTTITVEPAGAPSARYVRVRSALGLDQSLAAEVSAW
jgi:hypothetical protein